ncbi:MAG: hypothetical protein ABI664_00560 [bacterium]
MRFVAAAFLLTWIVLVGYFVHVQRVMRRSRDLLVDATMAGRQ